MRHIVLVLFALSVAAAQTHVTQTECEALVNGSGGSGAGGRMNNVDFINCITSSPGWSDNVNAQVGTTYTIVEEDAGRLTTLSNASPVAVTLPQAGTTGFEDGSWFPVKALGAGTVTITPTTSTINGAASLALKQYDWAVIYSDGTNYQALFGVWSHTSLGDIGSNTHTQIDTHLGSTSNPHSVTAGQVGAQALDAALTALAAGSDFVQFTGPTTSTKIFTLPDASSTLLYSGGALGTPSGGTLTNATGLPLTTGVTGILPGANGGTGNGFFAVTGPTTTLKTFTLPDSSATLLYSGGALGTPSGGTLTNATGLPISTGVSGLGTGVATALATPSSANLAAAITDEQGSGAVVFATSPTLTTPNIGVATATSVNKMAITAPATGSTLAVADGKTFTVSNTITFTGTDTASVAVGAGGTVVYKIASGTAALGTSSIGSGSCATVVTVAATGTATTDTITFTPNADITAVTGYAPVTTGGLAIYPYPTANNVNFKVCNPTTSSITPGAVTLNWRVAR